MKSKLKYFIPIVGLILMLIDPYETNSAGFVFGYILYTFIIYSVILGLVLI